MASHVVLALQSYQLILVDDADQVHLTKLTRIKRMEAERRELL